MQWFKEWHLLKRVACKAAHAKNIDPQVELPPIHQQRSLDVSAILGITNYELGITN